VSSHPIVHVELSANDFDSAGKFYSELFGWQVQHHPEMQYSTFMAEGGPGGGFAKAGENTPAGKTTVYVGTDDIDATLAKAEQLGGKILMPKMEIPNTGWMGLFQDPTGNTVGLYKAK
jgi:predicted enzyme related to lactoylglutathione lyase